MRRCMGCDYGEMSDALIVGCHPLQVGKRAVLTDVWWGTEHWLM